MKLAMRIIAVFFLLLAIFLAVDGARSRRAPRKVLAVKVGDSKAEVRRIMGRPSGVTTAGIFDHAETWAYGGYLNWAHTLSKGFLRFRLFGPDHDEVAIQFDGDGNVKKIVMPETEGK